MSTPKQALLDLEKQKTWPVYYLFGDEPFKINEFVAKVAALLFGSDAAQSDLAFCVDRIDGSSATGYDVLDAVQSLGLFAGASGSQRRLVLVRHAHQLKDVDALMAALTSAPDEAPWGDNVLLLIADSLDGRRKFHQWLKKKGYALEFKPARDAELMQWVEYLSKKIGAKVAPEAAQVLAMCSDGSLHRLAQEIEKAWLYAGAEKGAPLTVEHVMAVSSNQVTHEMIELIKAILESKRTRALLLSEKLIRSPEDALGLVGFLTWALKNPGRGFQTQNINYKNLTDGLLELDRRLKSSGGEALALVDQFVVEQTRPS